MKTLEHETALAAAANRIPPVLWARHVVKYFGSGELRAEVLKGLDIAIYPGELTLLMGPSGAGKSTVLAVLSGLLRPDEGEVWALGQALWTLQGSGIDDFRMRHCGFIFQGFNLFSALTAHEQVELVLGLTGVPHAEVAQRARQSLADVGLAPRAHLRPIELSGGEKQRVAIARALAKRPRLLFADEPTSALDGHNGQVVTALLRDAAHNQGAAVLCVTHDDRLVPHADRILHIEDGRITRDERPLRAGGPLAASAAH